MESDKHYFLEGLFVLVLALGIVLAFVWLGRTGERDDVRYRIRFAESVSGLALGDPVKFLGVDAGTVERMALDPQDPGQVLVEVKLRKDTPVKTDTRATLRIKGLTGAVFIELDGGSAQAPSLLAATPAGQLPEIPSEKGALNQLLEELPKVIAKFSRIEDQTSQVVADIGEVTQKVKENPSLLLRRPKTEKKDDERHEQRRTRQR
jgi:phospholipid/cholesterol/gamma-HCH transport system substrate-binding protein